MKQKLGYVGWCIILAERVTMPVLTKYERARVLGTRAQQIALNSPLMLDPGEEKDPYKIAELELNHGIILTKIWFGHFKIYSLF